MFNKIIFSLLIAFIFVGGLQAQESAVYTDALRDYNRALALYNDQQYIAAQAIFDKVMDQTNDETIEGNCAYYMANCAVRLNQLGADQMMESFVENYPTSTKRNSAFLDVASYYFNNGKYSYAQKWYKRVDESSLSRKQKNQYYFNNGYANFAAKQYDKAKTYFQRVRDDQEYGSQAKYYLGYIEYQNDNYEGADEYFQEVGDEERYREELTYFQADLNFKLGKFEKAIELAKEQIPNSNRQEISELNKIIGESHFNLEQYAQAIPFLKEYKGKRGKWNNTDYYQLGYAYYKQGNFENAISEFNKIIDGDNAVAQNAYYHLAQSYLKSDKKQAALNAFKNASEMDFDTAIQEDAFYNYGKLSYEIGNSYTSTPQVLNAFLEKYPTTDKKNEINDLLLNSYITSKNYEEALKLLESGRGSQNDAAYQQVAFYRGIELYNAGEYPDAIAMLKKSLTKTGDAGVTARAHYWIAESNYQLNKYQLALESYQRFHTNPASSTTPEMENYDYNLAYTYFSLKQYPAAITSFENYARVNTGDAARRNDAWLRAGDSHFVSSQYWPAMEAYNKAIEMGNRDADYASFQKAISYGFVQKKDQKINDLNAFLTRFGQSQYRDDALFELGNTYISVGNVNKGIETYDRLITEMPTSGYTSQAMMRKALQYYKDVKLEDALVVMRQVAEQYPSSGEAKQAVRTARLIYIDLERVDEYAAWVQGLDFYDLGDTELDDASYASAEKQFLENNMQGAIRGFEKYIMDYPNGLHALQAHFYLAQSYYNQEDKDNSITHYEYVISKERNEYSEQSLARLSEIFLGKQEYQKVIPVLEQLETTADFPQNIVFAQSNLMKAYHELDNHSQAIAYAEKVLANTKVDNTVKSDAQIIIARSSLVTGNKARARTAYSEVEKIATGALAAEALYYKALFIHEDGDFEQSNTVVQTIARDYSGYKYWAAKGLVVMAKNFYGLKDAYQAAYVLESVIQNFAQYQDVVDDAQATLDTIKAEEAKTNASVETEGN